MRFFPLHGNVMRAVVEQDHNLGRMISLRFPGDPFPTYIDHRQVQLAKGQVAPMSPRTAEAPRSPKELRRAAKTLGVRNWEEMDREELATAVAEAEAADGNGEGEAPARKATKKVKATKATKATKSGRKATAKTPAKKGSKRAAPRPAASDTDGPNPFRPGTNLYHVTEALMVGGKRSALVKKLLPKMEYNPRVQSADDFDPEAETDRRLKVIGYILKNQHGWEYEHEGRGPDAYIKATPPS